MDTTKQIDTPYNNAVKVINRTNELLIENNIKDSTGEITAQLDTTAANPAWLFALACGQLHTSWQQQLAKAYMALDPQNCEDDQVLVLAALAGIERGNGVPSHISVVLQNNGSDPLDVPYNTEFTESTTNHSWFLNKNIHLDGEDGTARSAVVILYSRERGAFEVPAGVMFSPVDEALSDLKGESISASFQGESIETIAALRNRISTGRETNDFVTQAAKAIEELGGIESCSIWFNTNSRQSLTVGNIVIPPRECYVAIKGVDIQDDLGETYFNYLDVPATVGEHSSNYTRGLQTFTVKYDVAQEVPVQIYVKIKSADIAVGAADALCEQLTKWSGTLACGENLTAQMVSEWLVNFSYGTIIGCNVGSEGSFQSDINPAQYCVWSKETIQITEV